MENPFQILEQADVGGLSEFEFIPTSSVSVFPDISEGQIREQEIALLPGKEWLVGYAHPETLEFGEIPKESNAGWMYEKSLDGIYPYDSALVASAFNALAYVPVLVKVTDRRSGRRLLGSIREPMRISWTFRTDKLGTHSGYNFSFTGKHRSKAPFLI